SVRIDTASLARDIGAPLLAASHPRMTGSALLTPQRYRSAYRFWLPTAMAFFVNGVGFGGWAAQVPRATARLGADEGAFGLMLLGMGIGAGRGMAWSGRRLSR